MGRPIFLVGSPRSGTTLLSTMLHAHPRLAMPPETSFLLMAYRSRAEYGDLRIEQNRRRLARMMTGRGTRFVDLGLDRGEIIEQIAAGPPTVGSAAGTIWRAFAHSRGKARWGDKRPAYWRDTGMVLRMFPDAQIVHLVRDGRACVASLKRVEWWTTGSIGAMATWVLADRELRRAGRRLPTDAYHRLRYEDLVADPRSELDRLCAFLGEDFDERMLHHAEAADDIVPARKRWHDRTRGALNPTRIEAWRTQLSAQEIGLFEFVASSELRRNGYPVSGAGTRPTPVAVAGYHRERLRKLAVMYKERVEDARLRRRDPQPLADLTRSSISLDSARAPI
jgi:Sulfotransferase family